MNRTPQEPAPRAAGNEPARPAAPRRGEPGTFFELQRSVGNRALARHIGGRPEPTASRGARRLQRVIGFGALAGAVVPGGAILGPGVGGVGGFGFYRITHGVPPVIRRPVWSGRWRLPPPGGWPVGQSRNHIIPYQLIGEALTTVSQTVYNAAAGVEPVPGLAARTQQLIDITESLYPNGAAGGAIPEHARMVMRRGALVNTIVNVVNHAAPTAVERAWLAIWATRLESSLMSSPENVRLGNAQMNLSIGANVDPIIHPNLLEVPAVPPGVVNNLPAGVLTPPGWTVLATLGATRNIPPLPPLAPGTMFYVMPQASNNIVYDFLTHATGHLGNEVHIVRNHAVPPLPGGALPVPGYPANAPLSSSPMLVAAAGNQPLLAFDPAGIALPYRFG